ncbi:MAG TPA: hypothetical protein VIE39_11625 [Thermoanaerobaculia bacterium]|jgi:hypothetical protein
MPGASGSWPPPDDEHEGRVRDSFGDFHRTLGDRIDDEARKWLDRLRDSIAGKDTDSGRKHLTEIRKRHSWLYEELAAHPRIANLLDELALLGL